jgi:hypothetical protein
MGKIGNRRTRVVAGIFSDACSDELRPTAKRGTPNAERAWLVRYQVIDLHIMAFNREIINDLEIKTDPDSRD